MDIAARHGLLVDRGRRAGHRSPRTGAGRSAASATWRRSQLPRDQEHHLGEGGALLSQRRALRRARRDHLARRAPTGASSSAARSTSTPGSTSARRYLPGEIVAAFLGPRLEEADAITAPPARDLAALPRGLRALRGVGHGPPPGRARAIARTTRTCTTCCCPTSKRAAPSSTRLKERGVIAVFHYVPLHSSPFGPRRAGARRAGAHDAARPPRAPAAVGRHWRRARPRDRGGRRRGV